MSWSKQSKWIWISEETQKDSYGEFLSEFSYQSGDVTVRVTVDSNYALYVNGEFVASEQYPDFPHYKVYGTASIHLWYERILCAGSLYLYTAANSPRQRLALKCRL